MSSMRIGVKQALASVRMDACMLAGWKIMTFSLMRSEHDSLSVHQQAEVT